MRLGGLSGGTIAAVFVVSLLLGKNPLEMLGLVAQIAGGPDQQAEQGGPPPGDDKQADFVRAILGETEDVWTTIFQSGKGTYQPPRMVLFSGAVRSACGGATSASGPFYCPGDRQVYLDLEFFALMKARLGGGGDFAQAYVIAHEVGHHVQGLLGLTEKVDRARERGDDIQGADGLLVRQELQADCLAGVWGNRAESRHHWLDPGDIDEALGTATAIGDDRLQKESRGTVVPDSFTHGSSKQRVAWFKRGFSSGEIGNCDTFGAPSL
jgi:predicted metalloprotease